MKTAVSIPDPLFKHAERLAKRSKLSRSELYARALQLYVRRFDRDEITRQANEYAAKFNTALPPAEKSRRYKRLLEVEW